MKVEKTLDKMSLREFASVMAMLGVLIRCPDMPNKVLARQGVSLADALIQELEK